LEKSIAYRSFFLAEAIEESLLDDDEEEEEEVFQADCKSICAHFFGTKRDRREERNKEVDRGKQQRLIKTKKELN
jgi:hypothetical protein